MVEEGVLEGGGGEEGTGGVEGRGDEAWMSPGASGAAGVVWSMASGDACSIVRLGLGAGDVGGGEGWIRIAAGR